MFSLNNGTHFTNSATVCKPVSRYCEKISILRKGHHDYREFLPYRPTLEGVIFAEHPFLTKLINILGFKNNGCSPYGNILTMKTVLVG